MCNSSVKWRCLIFTELTSLYYPIGSVGHDGNNIHQSPATKKRKNKDDDKKDDDARKSKEDDDVPSSKKPKAATTRDPNAVSKVVPWETW